MGMVGILFNRQSRTGLMEALNVPSGGKVELVEFDVEVLAEVDVELVEVEEVEVVVSVREVEVEEVEKEVEVLREVLVEVELEVELVDEEVEEVLVVVASV